MRADCLTGGKPALATPTENDARDDELMLAYAQGDGAAFGSLYARHASSLYHYVKRSCDSEAQANELYQDIWLRVIKASGKYRADAPFKAWLYRIAANRLTDHYRQHGRTTAVESRDDPETSVQSISSLVSLPLTPEEETALAQRAETLDSALKSLPAVQREALLLHHVAGMSLKEMASVTNQNLETLRSRLRYGSARLRTRLRELL